jgi:hypothetical protein
MKSLLFTLTLFLALVGPSFADPDVEVIEYYGTTFHIPAPEGFVRFDNSHPELAEPIRRASLISNSLLCAYGKPEEILARINGKESHFKILFLASEITDLRSVDVTPEMLQKIKEQFKGKEIDIQGIANEATGAVTDYLKEQDPTSSVKLNEPHLVGTFDDLPNSICLLVVAKAELTTNGTTERFSVLTVTAFVNVNRRVLLLSCGGEYIDGTTITAFKARVTKWRDQVVNLNPDKP